MPVYVNMCASIYEYMCKWKMKKMEDICSEYFAVTGCQRALIGERTYYKRYKICPYHSELCYMVVDDQAIRFCQQCGKFQLLKEFDQDKKSCRSILEKHNSRRRRIETLNPEDRPKDDNKDDVKRLFERMGQVNGLNQQLQINPHPELVLSEVALRNKPSNPNCVYQQDGNLQSLGRYTGPLTKSYPSDQLMQQRKTLGHLSGRPMFPMGRTLSQTQYQMPSSNSVETNSQAGSGPNFGGQSAGHLKYLHDIITSILYPNRETKGPQE